MYVFSWTQEDSSFCARKFCCINAAMPFNQNNLKLLIDTYNSTGGSNNIDDDNDNHHHNSHFLSTWHLAKSFMWIIPVISFAS